MRWLLLIAAIMTIATLLAVWRGEELPPATMGDRGPAIAMPPAAGAAAPANSPVGSDSSPDLPSAAVSTGATPGATTIPADAVSTPAADEPQGPALRGRVFGIDSTPIAGAVVTLLPVLDGRVAAPLTTTGLPSARTAADGRFTIRFANESPRDLAVAARGWSPTVVAAVTPIPNGPEWIVTLARPSRVAGRVVAVPGTGAGGITVQVWMAGAAPSRAPPDLGPGDLCPGGQLVAERVLAADGAFTFDDLPAGRAVVGVTPQHGSVHEIVPLAPGSEHTIELVLPVPGRVHGRAEPGCCVFLFGGQASRFVTAAADGAFEFAAVPPAKYLIGSVRELRAAELHAVRQEYLVSGRSTLAREIVVPRGAGLEVELPPPVLRTGAVAGNAWLRGEPAGGAEVVLRPVDGVGAYVRRARVEAGGAFRIEDVPTGDFDAELRPEGAAEPAARQRCRVVAGAVAEVTLIAP